MLKTVCYGGPVVTAPDSGAGNLGSIPRNVSFRKIDDTLPRFDNVRYLSFLC
jgi:hypothetical protein